MADCIKEVVKGLQQQLKVKDLSAFEEDIKDALKIYQLVNKFDGIKGKATIAREQIATTIDKLSADAKELKDKYMTDTASGNIDVTRKGMFGNPFYMKTVRTTGTGALSAMYYEWLANGKVPDGYVGDKAVLAEKRNKIISNISVIQNVMNGKVDKKLFYNGTAKDKDLSHVTALMHFAREVGDGKVKVNKSAIVRKEYDKLPGRSGTKTMTFAGVGSRSTPPEILKEMVRVAGKLEKIGYTLNTGLTFGDKAEGADKAFADGFVDKNKVNLSTPEVQGKRAREQAIALEIHETPEKLTEGALKLQARNTNQVFGDKLDTPVDFVLAWAPLNNNGEVVTHADQRYYGGKDNKNNTGGTGQAIALASLKGIPVINMADPAWEEQLDKLLAEKTSRDTKPATDSRLTEEQEIVKEELLEFFKSDVQTHVLDAAGGTGKTYTLGKIVDEVEQMSKNQLLFIAPSHAAVSVLTESMQAGGVDRRAVTIAKALGMKPEVDVNGAETGRFKNNPFAIPIIEPGSYIVVDESSMVNDYVYDELLRAVGSTGKILFMGDSAQLPPIQEEENTRIGVSKGLTPVKGAKKSTLTKVMRFNGDSDIGILTEALRDNSLNKKQNVIGVINKLQLINDGSTTIEDSLRTVLGNFVEQYKSDAKGTVILTYFNENNVNHPQSVYNLNTQLHKMLYPNAGNKFVEGEAIVLYDKTVDATAKNGEVTQLENSTRHVIQKINNIGRLTFNGSPAMEYMEITTSEGVTAKIWTLDGKEAYKNYVKKLNSEAKAKVKRGVSKKIAWADRYAFTDKFANIAIVNHGYAITTHKSQGQSFNNVTVMLDGIASMHDKSEQGSTASAYVALSRPRKKLTIVSSKINKGILGKNKVKSNDTVLNENVEVVDKFDRATVQANPDKIYVFGDNTDSRVNKRKSLKEAAGSNTSPTTTQAQIRGLDNAFGIDTKKSYNGERVPADTDFFSDADYDKYVAYINKVIAALKEKQAEGKTIVLPKYGIGTGKASLQDKAPKLYKHLAESLNELAGYEYMTIGDSKAQESINVYSTVKNGYEKLSNLTVRPFTYDGKKYKSVEHAYQTLKSGKFDSTTYEDKRWGQSAVKVAGKLPVNKDISYKLMKDLIKASLEQNRAHRELLLSTGDKNITHTQEKGEWGSLFPKALMEIRSELRDGADKATTKVDNGKIHTDTTDINDVIQNSPKLQKMLERINQKVASNEDNVQCK